MKTAFIIPGYRESPKGTAYLKMAKTLRQSGFRAEILDVPWKRRVMSDYIEYVQKKLESHKTDDTYLIGFSFGAYISFVLSSRINIRGQILCSVSPYFKETLSRLPRHWKEMLGQRRIEDFSHFSYRSIAQKVKTKTTMLYGELETQLVPDVSIPVYKLLKVKKSLVEIPGVKHNIHDPKYLIAVQKVISKL